MGYQTLELLSGQGGDLTIALNRPEVRNAFNDEVIQELTSVFNQEAADPAVKVVVLKGNGKVFCAGGDLNWMKKSVDFSYEENLQDTRKLAALFALMNEFPKPVVGSIHGAAIGGGVGLVSICDIAISTQNTVFSLSEVKLGLIPACIGPFVIAKIGASHARELFISANRFNGKRAREIGLVHYVATDEMGLAKQVDQTVQAILQCGPAAIAAAKKLVLGLSWPEKRQATPDCLEMISEMLAELRVSKEGQEGVKAFLEKRSPRW